MRQWTLLALGIVFLCPAVWAGESMLYSITNESTTVLATNRTSQIGYPVVEPKTDIFAIDPDIGKKRLIFSDANAAFLLLPWKSGDEIVTGVGRIFARAVDRQDYANDSRGICCIYEAQPARRIAWAHF